MIIFPEISAPNHEADHGNVEHCLNQTRVVKATTQVHSTCEVVRLDTTYSL